MTTDPSFFQGNVDQLARSAVCAFSLNKLTREQAATVLELREMNNALKDKDFSGIKSIDFLDKNNEFTKEALSILPNFLSFEDQSKFLEILKENPVRALLF